MNTSRFAASVLVLCGTLIGLAIAEVGARYHAHWQHGQRLADWQRVQQQRTESLTGEAPFGRIIRISAYPDIIYEFVPGLNGMTFRDQPLATNRHGFRGPDYPVDKPDGVTRIVGIGDSVMFGWGVPEPASFLRVVERGLNASRGSERFQVINTAVPGHNTAMEVATLEHKGLQFAPDLVILTYIGNDTALPNLIADGEGPDVFALDKLFLWDFLAGRLGTRPSEGDMALVQAPKADGGPHFANRPDDANIPPKYRYMVGTQGVVQALEELKRLQREHGFAVLVTTLNWAPKFLVEACERLGFRLLDVKPIVRRYRLQHGIEEYLGSPLTVSATDPHPSTLQHRLHGKTILDLLAAEPHLLGL